MDLKESKPRKGRVSEQQKNILVDFMLGNPDLKSGQFSSTFRQEDSVRLWGNLAELLNSDGLGASKTVEKWKACWRDMKLYTKDKASKIKKSLAKTGGVFATANPLTELEKKILSLMGISSTYKIPGASKSCSEAFEILTEENGEIVIVNDDIEVQEDDGFPLEQVVVPSREKENGKDSKATSSSHQLPNKKRKLIECFQATYSTAQKLAKVLQSQNEESAEVLKEIGKELVQIEKQKLAVEQESVASKKEHQKIMQGIEREKLNEQRRTAKAFEAILQELLAKK